ncbi:ABC-type transporter, integral membrane subunit [Desulfocurvibacter africanus subsp. africanus str. Walvis Bay]|uniref:ABC-type transporter, integral membrane subunit n=1 Tax=Desulfocurvibacter africanus subsp. africanus str. Walvis Bay TaxID=690850 RepID=F3YUM2_DESAF|nr:branched-chain amino acid ABC transporter permease [Desulfocurvibacter africanus]EGJ48976.1 ABC-type transporter, integral membrane subunit [Desulfocurvibacter africanus subsp. africanus str. Walvis Bay]
MAIRNDPGATIRAGETLATSGFDLRNLSVPAILLIAFVGLLAACMTGALNLYMQTVLMFMGINIIMSTSLNLINGNMGEFACGHAAFMAVGAYVSSLVTVIMFTQSKFGAPLLPPELTLLAFPLALLIGSLAAALVGLLIAIPSFKTRGDYLAIITIAALYIVKSAIENIDAIGGARGFMGMRRVTNAMEQTLDLPWMVIWIFIGTVFTVWIIRRYVSSTYGKGVMAICQDEVAAEIMSVNTNHIKLVTFMLSSGLAGLAGGLFAHVLGYINPGSFTILKSTEALVMVYLGGMGSISGAVMSAMLFTLLLESLRFIIPWIDQLLHLIHVLPAGYEISQVWKWVLIPLLLILLMQFRPEGIMGNRELSDIFPRLRKFYKFK